MENNIITTFSVEIPKTEFAKWSEGKADIIPEQVKRRSADNKYFAELSERLGL